MTTASPVARRDAQGTRERILNAALAEFSASGFSGARIHAIARRAGVNVRMLYHYFGEKDDLFRAILRRRFAERPIQPDAAPPAPLGKQMQDWFDRIASNPDWVRLTQWEALEAGDEPLVEEAERRHRWGATIERIRAEQTAGRVPSDLDADLLVLAMVALATFPIASSPVVRLVSGAQPSDAAFQRRYRRFLARLSAHLTEE